MTKAEKVAASKVWFVVTVLGRLLRDCVTVTCTEAKSNEGQDEVMCMRGSTLKVYEAKEQGEKRDALGGGG